MVSNEPSILRPRYRTNPIYQGPSIEHNQYIKLEVSNITSIFTFASIYRYIDQIQYRSSPLLPRPSKRRRGRKTAPVSIVAPPFRGSDLPGEFSAIDHISATRQQPLPGAHPPSRNRKRRHQLLLRQYLVHWAPEILPYLEVQKQRAAGFRTSSIKVISQVHNAELDDDDVQAPCHQCGLGAGHQHSGPSLLPM